MSIHRELSGDIASAIVSAKQHSPGELRDLRDTILKIHDVLEQLSDGDAAEEKELFPEEPKMTIAANGKL